MRQVLFLALLICGQSVRADDAGTWVSLFNGRDLSNWVNVNCALETWRVEGGVIKCTGKPTGALRTPRMYENFILELDWRHMRPGGNAGIFVWASAIAAPGAPFLRAIEVQVLDNAFNVPGKNKWYTTHGDVFPIFGTTMKPIHHGDGMRCFPSEERSKSSPEWNHYRVVGRDGKIRLSVNGKEVSGGDDVVWRKGYLGLESEGSPTEWRNLRIMDLPSGHATAAQSAPEDEAWRPLYNGIDLRGWKAAGELRKQWSPADWRLRCAAGSGVLTTQQEWGDFELIVDVRASKPLDSPEPAMVVSGSTGSYRAPLRTSSRAWTRNRLSLRRGRLTTTTDGGSRTNAMPGLAARRSIGLSGTAGSAVEFGNIYIREIK